MITSKSILINWFKRGLKPLASQFAAWLDSYWHKDELIPPDRVDGLISALSLFGALTDLVNTTGPIITLDMGGLKQKNFVGDNPINSAKTWAFANAGNATVIQFFRFTLTGAYPQTMPITLKMESYVGTWQTNNPNEWQPDSAGDFEAMLTHYNGEWRLRITGY
jgi:hypothetical protein